MKQNLTFITIFLFFLTGVYAQKSSTILRGGLNLANVSITENGTIDEANRLTSFHVGIIGDLHVSEFLAIQPGFMVTGKGSKTQDGNPSDANYYKATSNPVYVEIPVSLVFKGPIGKDSRFLAGAGPYLAIGIAGKNKTEGKFLGASFRSEEDIRWSNDDPSTLNYEEGAGFGIMKRFDYGLNGMVGIDTKSAVFSINYGLGLAKLQSGSNSSSDDKNKHRVLGISVGFKL